MTISVIVPVYNSEKYLSVCLSSIIGQTYLSLEILLIDDGSTDKSGEICDSYAEKDKRIKVFHVKNAGQAAARNLGIQNASGTLVAFVDSDDILDKTMYEKLANIYLHKNCLFPMCGCYRFSEKGRTSEEKLEGAEFNNKTEIFEGLGLPMLYPHNGERFIIPSACRSLYVRDILLQKNIRFPNERQFLGEDLIFNLLYLMEIDKAEILNESLYGYRVNASSFTNNHSFNPARLASVFNMADKIKQILTTHECFAPNVNQRLMARILDNVSVAIKLSVAAQGFKAAKRQMQAARENAYVKKALNEAETSSFNLSLKLFCALLKAKMYLPLYSIIKIFLLISR